MVFCNIFYPDFWLDLLLEPVVMLAVLCNIWNLLMLAVSPNIWNLLHASVVFCKI